MDDFRWSACIAVVGLSLLAGGCASPMTRSETSSTAMASDKDDSFDLVSATDRKAMVFTDSPKLQYGTGPVDPDADLQFKATSSGLRYRVLRKSDGTMPTVADRVTVNYRGWLDSGKEFDSSYDGGEPISFSLAQVVPGWTEGMQLVGEGGMIELWIPARLGYGKQGSPGSVPPNATLHFVVELIRVN